MGLRFRKSVKIAPGVKLNFNKKSTGLTIGGKGAHYTINSKGKKTTSFGIPGTGISYSSTSENSKSKGEDKDMKKTTVEGKKKGCGLFLIPAIIILFIIGGIGSCVGKDDKSETTTSTTEISTTIEKTTEEKTITIESIEFSDADPLKLEIGDSEYNYIRVVYDDTFSEDDIVFVSSDESVATITLNRKRNSLVYFDIEAIGSGTATVYAQTVDGAIKSEEITVTVVENDTTSKKTETTEAKAAVIDKETNAPKATENSKEYVLNTNTMKIHESYCSSVKDIDPGNYAKTSDYDKAISQGYVPCKRCNP